MRAPSVPASRPGQQAPLPPTASTRKPRLLVLTSTFPRWRDDNQPPFVFELSRRLTNDFDITVLAPRAPGSLDREEMDGLHIVRFAYFIRRWENLATHGGGILNRLQVNPLNYLLLLLFLTGQLRALLGLLRRGNYDLIHAHWLIPQGLLAVVARRLVRCDAALVCTSHGGDLFALRGALLRRLKIGVMRNSRMITVVSTVMRKQVLRMNIARDQVEVIPMGVDLQQRFTPDPNQPRSNMDLLFVGRLVEKKGVQTMLHALPRVISRYPEVRLTIAGSGPLEQRLRQLARDLGIAHCVRFLGQIAQADLPRLYRQAALFIAPFQIADSGDQEGLGLVLVEAMSCGCCVLCGAVPATADAITDGITGACFAPGDPEALAEKIIALLADPHLRARLADNGRAHCRKAFDWEHIATRYRRVLMRSLAPVTATP